MILVTGASGFVGRALCEHLRGRGLSVRGATRRPLISTARPDLPVHVVGDVNGATDWAGALDEIETVVHLAAHVHVPGRGLGQAGRFREVNVEGTRRLARACVSSGVRRLVFLSTVGVCGEESRERPFREEDPPRPTNPYASSKLEAEEALLAIAAETGLEATIVRAPMSYGPDPVGNFKTLLDWTASRRPVPLIGISSLRSFVGVTNLASFLTACVLEPRAANEVFLISDGEDVEVGQFVARLARSLGRRRGLFKVPAGLLLLAALSSRQRHALRRLMRSIVVDSGKARRLLSWTPPLSVEAELNRVAAWRRAALSPTEHPAS